MNISLTDDEKKQFEQDAKFMDMSLSEFVRNIRRYWKKEKTKDIPHYHAAIEWIAMNDEPTEFNLKIVSSMISVQLIADLYGTTGSKVAKDVIAVRRLSS